MQDRNNSMTNLAAHIYLTDVVDIHHHTDHAHATGQHSWRIPTNDHLTVYFTGTTAQLRDAADAMHEAAYRVDHDHAVAAYGVDIT